MASLDAARKAYVRDVRAAMTLACDQSAKLLLESMKELTARIDHDLKQLREMGHPYRANAPQGIPHADWIVHLQDGELHGGLQALPATVTGTTIEADILSKARHTWYLLLGTRKMRPRDFVSAAIIFRKREVEAIFERCFLAIHDQPLSVGESLEARLIPHPVYPAQLPGGV